jgi:hypothetical protein
MQLQQLEISFQHDEDRLLLRAAVRAADGGLQEIRAWVTRQLLRDLWPALMKAMETRVILNQPSAANASAEIAGMGHEASLAALQQAGSFGTPFPASIDVYPLGETPLLITSVDLTVDADRPLRINFASKDQTGFEVALTTTMFHGFCRLLQQAAGAAEWDIALQLPAPVAYTSRTLN